MSVKNVITRGLAVVGLLGLMLCTAPDSARTEDAAAPTTIRVALMVPRAPEVEIQAKKYNQKLAEMTNNSVQVRIYWGGAAGDDRDVLRKMRSGQMDGAPLSLELVSNFVRQALIMAAPALFTNYKQLDAVRAAVTPEMGKEAYENGFKIMAWGDVGRLRLLSKKPISKLSDFKTSRPWLYPESEMLKEFYKIIGATGVPLGLAEVYGGLQTNMIDVIWASALLAAALQWHTGTNCISEKGLGFISGAFVFRRGLWETLPDGTRNAMQKLADEQAQKTQMDLRKADERAYQKLVERGFTPLRPSNEQEWWDAGNSLRKKLIGRIYTKEQVERAEAIALKYKD
ncbi:MAG TPA: TRAP transporter substrate-binding protein DctP [Polyangiales bacterium]|jgi:TRAP-type C4-dicarboxylate transport system substrate-binding protein|nr:TRAP transporter substrate-binding protein DctP [Polyangiales bacterium]